MKTKKWIVVWVFLFTALEIIDWILTSSCLSAFIVGMGTMFLLQEYLGRKDSVLHDKKEKYLHTTN